MPVVVQTLSSVLWFGLTWAGKRIYNRITGGAVGRVWRSCADFFASPVFAKIMFRRVPQPPVTASLRDPEHHKFFPGLTVVLAGAVLLVQGARDLSGVETTEGDRAWETQLVKAFSNGGLRYPDDESVAPPPPPPPDPRDPAGSAAALERWERQNRQAAAPAWKVRVDTGATTPCPT